MRRTGLFALAVLLLVSTVALPVFALEVNIVMDGDFADWADIPVLVEDPDDILEDNGDIKEIRVYSTKDMFYAMLTVYGEAAPTPDNQRFYYHLLIDADNNTKTGFSNEVYEGNDTGVKQPIGADFYIQIGRRDGADDGIEIYFLGAGGEGAVIADSFEWVQGGDSLELQVPFEVLTPLAILGDIFLPDQVIQVAAFQEGSANDWEVDWTEPGEHIVAAPLAVEPADKLTVVWAALK